MPSPYPPEPAPKRTTAVTYANLLSFARKPAAPPSVTRPGGLVADKSRCVASLLANLLDRAARTGAFRGAIPAHPDFVIAPVIPGSDEGSRADLDVAAIATATSAAITVADMDAARLGFLTVSPLHKKANGYDPDWQFDDPEAAMTARCRIDGISLEIACFNDPGGAATITLELVP